ncbi:hypothetical protein [uncultured Nostoc sp.]|uniref:hypothetical protein n=1 Tax=uncultured Nostoc sp. TaxID=340711 RepID=UPI0035CA827F
MDESKIKEFLIDLEKFIAKKINIDSSVENSINCCNMFDDNRMYEDEEKLLSLVLSSRNKSTSRKINTTTTVQGDSLEDLMKSLFGRVKFIDDVRITNRDLSIGQVDLQLTPIDDIAYKILGLINDQPLGMIGECKNYAPSNKIKKEEIEKTCWRACKSGSLSFFLGQEFTSGSLKEIEDFNLHKSDICKKNSGVFIVPLNLEMIKSVIEKKINFCYFIKWAIHRSKSHNLTPYLRDS